jgi:hypothetical protein
MSLGDRQKTATVSAAVGQWLVAQREPDVASQVTVIDQATVGRDAGQRRSFPRSGFRDADSPDWER